jgi:hypothetical protein
VRDQLGVIDTLLRSVRPPVRHRVLQLGAKYAESAAWLRPHDPRRPRRGRGHTRPPRRPAGRLVRRRGHVTARLLSPPRRPG